MENPFQNLQHLMIQAKLCFVVYMSKSLKPTISTSHAKELLFMAGLRDNKVKFFKVRRFYTKEQVQVSKIIHRNHTNTQMIRNNG